MGALGFARCGEDDLADEMPKVRPGRAVCIGSDRPEAIGNVRRDFSFEPGFRWHAMLSSVGVLMGGACVSRE